MLVVTCNSPGETAGWLRPLLRAIYSREPGCEIHVFFVPDDYATGQEPHFVRSLFPQAHVHDVRAYLRAALGAKVADLPGRASLVLYLGGDLFHAARLQRRFHSRLATYKFNRKRYAGATLRSYAIDSANAQTLERTGLPKERIRVVGNLAIDGALAQAEQSSQTSGAKDGIVFLPGSRPAIFQHMIPFLFTAALAVRRERPEISITFGISPFTTDQALANALESGGDWRVFAKRGKLRNGSGTAEMTTLDSSVRFPVARNAIAAAKDARLAVTIPGTNVIELAALGIPVLSCSAANAPELIAINGPLTYLDRIPLVGVPLKVRLVVALGKRFPFHTQPNIDAQRSIVRELHGTLTPGRVAREAIQAYDDERWLAQASGELRSLYQQHAGASDRMAADLLTIMREP